MNGALSQTAWSSSRVESCMILTPSLRVQNRSTLARTSLSSRSTWLSAMTSFQETTPVLSLDTTSSRANSLRGDLPWRLSDSRATTKRGSPSTTSSSKNGSTNKTKSNTTPRRNSRKLSSITWKPRGFRNNLKRCTLTKTRERSNSSRS